MKEGFQNVFIGEQTLDLDDFSLKERDQGATITLPGTAWAFSSVFTRVCSQACVGGSCERKSGLGSGLGEALHPLQSPLAVLVHRIGETQGAQRRSSTL